MERKLPPLASKWLEDLLVPIDSIRPHPDNYKEHPDEQLDSLNASLLAFGWTKPICADPEGLIVSGHGMYYEALKKGYSHVPVEPVDFNKHQSKAYLVADNETARKAKTDQGKLINILEDTITIPGFNIQATGFSQKEVDLFLHIDNNFSFDTTEEDASPLNNYPGTNESEDEDEPEDMIEVEGKKCMASYSVYISFSQQETAEIFLSKIGAKNQTFVPGKTSTVVDGDELEL